MNWQEYERQLYEAALRNAQPVMNPGPVYGPVMAPVPQQQAPVNPWQYLAKAPPVQPRKQAAAPVQPQQSAEPAPVQNKKADPAWRQWVKDQHPGEIAELRTYGMSEDEAIDVYLDSLDAGQPIQTVDPNAPSLADVSVPQPVQTAISAATAPAAAMGSAALDALPEPVKTGIDLVNPFNNAGIVNAFTGEAVSGEPPAPPKEPPPPHESPGGYGPNPFNFDHVTDEDRGRVFLESLKPIYTEKVIAEELTRIEAEIAALEAKPADEKTGEALELLKLDRDKLMALNYIFWGVEPPAPDAPWYMDLANAGLTFMGLYDKPGEMNRQQVFGTLVYLTASGRLPGGQQLQKVIEASNPLGPIAYETINTFGSDYIIQLYEEGGPEAVWEQAVAQVPNANGMGSLESALWHAYTDTSTDPLNLLGGAAVATKGVPLLGKITAGADVAANLPGDLIIGGTSKVAQGLGKAPGIRWLFEPSSDAVLRRDVVEPTAEFGQTLQTAGHVDTGTGTITAPQTTPTVTEITSRPTSPVETAVRAPKKPGDPGYTGPGYRVAPDDAPTQIADQQSFNSEALASLEVPNHPDGRPFTRAEFQTYKRTISSLTTDGAPFEQAVDDAYATVTKGIDLPAAPLGDDILTDLSPSPSAAESPKVTAAPEPDVPPVTRTAPEPDTPTAIVDDDLTLTTNPDYAHLNPGYDGTPRLIEKLASLPDDLRVKVWPAVRRLTDELIADPKYTGRPKGQRTKQSWQNAGEHAWNESLRTQQYVTGLARVYKSAGGEVLPDQVFTIRRASGVTGAPSVDDTTDWLIQRYITTGNRRELTRIERILRGIGNSPRSDEGKRIGRRTGGFANEDFKTGEIVSPFYVDQVISDLKTVRADWQDVMRGGGGGSGDALGLTPFSSGRARQGLDWLNQSLDRAGQIRQPDNLTLVADSEDWFAPFKTRKDRLARFAQAGTISGDTATMLDQKVPLVVEKGDPERLWRTGKKRLTAEQKKIIKTLYKVHGEGAEVKRWDVFEQALLTHNGNLDRAIRDFAVLMGEGASELRAGLKQFAWFWNGAKNMIRHAWMYNTPRLGYNLAQDTLTDQFTHLVDGQIEAAEMARRAFRSGLQQQLENSRYKPTRHIGEYVNQHFPSSVQEEVESLHEILGLPIGENVASLTGARFDDISNTIVEEGKTWWTRKAGLAGSVIAPDWVRNLRTMFDDMKRLATKTEFMQRNVGTVRDDFYDYIRTYAGSRGLDADDIIARLDNTGSDYFGQKLFGPDTVRQIVPGGHGEHLARRWKAHTVALDKDARRHMEKYLFSYRQTNLDARVGRVFLFHYWMSRASVLHARLALDNPWLMAMYARSWEGMQNQEQENMPAWAQQFIGLNVGPYGMMGVVSAAALLTGLGTILDLNEISEYDGIADVLKILPTNPIIMAAASVYLQDQTPDLTGTNQVRQFYKAAANWLNAEAGMPFDGVVPDYVANGTYWLQDVARAVLPGGKPLSYPSPEERDLQAVQFYASQIMQERGLLLDENGAPTDQANQVMANIEIGAFSGEIEQEAYERWATDMMAGRLAATQFPVQSITPGFAASQRTLNRQGEEAVRGEITIDPNSPTGFGSTAREMTPEEAAADWTVRMADAGSLEASQLYGSMEQYNNLGSDEQRKTWGLYYQALYGAGDTLQAQLGGAAMILGPNVVSYDEWDQLDHDARAALLDQWIAAEGFKGEWNAYRDLRDTFEEANPHVAGYKEWQDQIRTVGAETALAELLRISPSFAAWWNAQHVQPAYTQIVLMRPEAYLAAQGNKPGQWDSNATAGPSLDMSQVNPMTVIAPQQGAGYSGGPSFDHMTTSQRVTALQEDIVEYQEKMREWDAQARALTGGRSFESLAPLAQQALQGKMPSQPRGSAILQSYIDWMRTQPPSADVSVETFVTWYEQMEQQQASA